MTTILKYHGTSVATATNLQMGNINPALGGGELGQGFYVGDQLWIAKAWAFNCHKKSAGVLRIEVPDQQFNALLVEVLTRPQAVSLRQQIKKHFATKTYRHGCDVLWSPIVGTTKIEADQYKYETPASANVLNGAACTRDVV